MGSLLFFFFKQKTVYEMRISDWSSDVCSSDLLIGGRIRSLDRPPDDLASGDRDELAQVGVGDRRWACGRRGGGGLRRRSGGLGGEIGRASCRERVCQYVEIPVVDGLIKQKTYNK